ncbi:hypothetical protein I0C86_16180 [Plantactinospora sp. S1510]|uniref:Uncharacterized protein n=1 Tax=Plantactinospora alkalitolerans TaxID=2789879 RepID=A0ABS0GWN5_9ACTN|nr:hypothetical protein [Plantactinospora alkalitolerans]MBF9130486.1 hypothetical protein [Plantactinospora alkalitolerans]
MLFVEVIGDRPLPDSVDRDDVEDAIVEAVGEDGEVTGAGAGSGRWHLDLEIGVNDAAAQRAGLLRAAKALVRMDLGWVRLRPEGEVGARSTADFVR